MAEPEPADPAKPVKGSRFTLTGDETWPGEAADRVVQIVGAVKDKTTGNVVLAVRAVVYGLVALAGAGGLLILLTVAAVRLADAYLPIGAGVGSATWAAHLFVGIMLVVVGAGLWKARGGSAKPVYAALIVDAAILIGIVFYGTIAGLI